MHLPKKPYDRLRDRDVVIQEESPVWMRIPEGHSLERYAAYPPRATQERG